MEKGRRLVLVVIGLLLFFAVSAPAHTVHHGLHDVDSEKCPVLAVSTQTNGELPNIFPLPTSLLLIDALPTFDLILSERFAPQVYRIRAPPVSLPA